MKFIYFPYPAIAWLISFDFVVFSVDRLPIYPCPVLTCFRMIPITVQYTIPCRFFPFLSIMVELAPPPYLLAVRHVLPTLLLITGTPPLFHSSWTYPSTLFAHCPSHPAHLTAHNEHATTVSLISNLPFHPICSLSITSWPPYRSKQAHHHCFTHLTRWQLTSKSLQHFLSPCLPPLCHYFCCTIPKSFRIDAITPLSSLSYTPPSSLSFKTSMCTQSSTTSSE